MALFNRGNKTDVPPEIQEYYQTERRERAGIAWLLAFGTLVVTIVLAAGIFFAGRWAYRKIAGDGKKDAPTTQVAQNENQSQENQPAESSNDQTSEETKKAEEQRAEQERQAEEARRVEEERKAEEARKAEDERKAAEARQQETAQTQTPSGQVSGQSTPSQVATTGDSIPDTGPGDTVAIFFAVSVLGYMTHRLYIRKTS